MLLWVLLLNTCLEVLKRPFLRINSGFACAMIFAQTVTCILGSLHDVLNRKGRAMPMKMKLRLTLDVAKGLKFLHNKRVVSI